MPASLSGSGVIKDGEDENGAKIKAVDKEEGQYDSDVGLRSTIVPSSSTQMKILMAKLEVRKGKHHQGGRSKAEDGGGNDRNGGWDP